MYSCVDDVNDGCLTTGEGTTELIVSSFFTRCQKTVIYKTFNSISSVAISSPPITPADHCPTNIVSPLLKALVERGSKSGCHVPNFPFFIKVFLVLSVSSHFQ